MQSAKKGLVVISDETKPDYGGGGGGGEIGSAPQATKTT